MKTSFAIGVAVLAGIIAAACATGGHGSEPCTLNAQDSTYLRRGPVFRDCAVQKKAVLITKDLHPVFRPTQARSTCFSAEAEFVVNAAGAPEMETARLTYSTDPEFGMALMSLVPQLRFNPAEMDGLPVRQIVSHKEQIQVLQVTVPAGSTPPKRPPGTRAPSC